MKKGLMGIQVLLMAFSILSIIAFVTLGDELKGIVYQLPRHAATYSSKLKPICENGQDEEYVTLPAPPMGVVIKLDNCKDLKNKAISRGIISTVYTLATFSDFRKGPKAVKEAVKEFKNIKSFTTLAKLGGLHKTAAAIGQVTKIFWQLRGVTIVTVRDLAWNFLLSFDPDPNAILAQYENANADMSLVFSTILQEGNTSMRTIPVGIDENIIVSGKIGTNEIDSNAAIDKAIGAGMSIISTYQDTNKILATLFNSLDDVPYASANFLQSSTISYTFVGDQTKVFLRPEHATRLFKDIARAAKEECSQTKSNANKDAPEYTRLVEYCQELSDELDEGTYLLADQNIINELDNKDPWENVTSYFSALKDNFADICSVQRPALKGTGMSVTDVDSLMTEKTIMDFCTWHSSLQLSINSINGKLSEATEYLQDMRAGRTAIHSILASKVVDKTVEASKQGVSVEDVDVLGALDEGRCVATYIPTHDESGTVIGTMIIPSCAFQISCQKDDVTLMNYQDSCMLQLINIGDGYSMNGNLMPMDALPSGPVDYPSAAGMGATIGEKFLGGQKRSGGITSALPLLGSKCKTFDDTKLVFCLEAENGCASAETNCRFCYTFQCNVPVVTTPDVMVGITVKHEADKLLLRGNFLPL